MNIPLLEFPFQQFLNLLKLLNINVLTKPTSSIVPFMREIKQTPLKIDFSLKIKANY